MTEKQTSLIAERDEAALAQPCKVESYMHRSDWLRGTHQSIGASASSRIVGLSRYGSPYSEWVRFTEPLVIDEPDEMQRWGLLLEPVILAEFARQAGVRAEQPPPYTVHRSRERPYIHATLDAITDGGEPVELKTAHFTQAKIWKTEVPLPYMVQVQHQIYVTGAKQGYIAVLVDGYQFAWHRVARHQKFIDRLLKRLDHFWHEYVEKRQPPPVDYSAATPALLRLYPTANGSCVDLPDDAESLYDEMKTLTATEAAAKKRKEWIKNYVRERMGENRYGRCISGRGFQWAGENGSRRFTLTERCPDPTSHD